MVLLEIELPLAVVVYDVGAGWRPCEAKSWNNGFCSGVHKHFCVPWVWARASRMLLRGLQMAFKLQIECKWKAQGGPRAQGQKTVRNHRGFSARAAEKCVFADGFARNRAPARDFPVRVMDFTEEKCHP